MRKRLSVLILVLFVLGVAGVGAVSDYSITVDDSYDTPAENVTVDGEEFTVSAISATRPGENLTVRVTAPENERYQINIYNLDQQIQDFRLGRGNETVTFDTDEFKPGSYVVAAADNGEFYAVHPVVVTDYRLETDVPARAKTNSSFEVSASLDPIVGETTPGTVEIVFWNDRIRQRYEMTETGDGTYETTISGLPAGTYQVYTVVIAAERVDGEQNVVGVSEPASLTVDETGPSTPTPTPTPSTQTPTPTPTPSPTPTVSTPTPTTPTSTPDGVITPGNRATPSGDGDGDIGFGIIVALGVGFVVVMVVAAVLGGIMLAVRSSRTEQRG